MTTQRTQCLSTQPGRRQYSGPILSPALRKFYRIVCLACGLLATNCGEKMGGEQLTRGLADVRLAAYENDVTFPARGPD